MTSLKIAAIAACLTLAGCGYESPSPGDVTPAPAAAPSTAGTPTVRGNAWVDPADVSPCAVAKGVSGTVHWDYTAKEPQIGAVRVTVPASETGETVFAEGGASGNATTGGWLQPGTKFFFRNASDGALLDTVIIGEAPCN